MLRVFLDAHLLAMPQRSDEPLGEAVSTFEDYVKRLLELNEARRSGFASMFLPSDAEEALFEAGLYPLWDGLATALTAANLDGSYQPQDIVSVVDGLLKQLPRLEDELRIESILAEPADLHPDDYLREYPTALADSHRRLMLLACLLLRANGRSSCGDFVIVERLPARAPEVSVRGRIEDWVLSSPEPCQRFPLPLDLIDRVRLIRRWRDVRQVLDPLEVWRMAASAEHRIFAFRTFLLSFAEANGLASSVAVSESWSFGSSFLGSVDMLGFGRERAKIQRLLTAMAATVFRINLNQVHQLRTGQAGNNPQVKRGQDGAWRRDIDDEFHLHFWSTPTGAEFAATVVHNDFAIPG